MKKEYKPPTIISPIHRAGRQIALFLGRQTEKLGLTPDEAHLLTYVDIYGPCPVNELIRVFGHKNTTMTSTLDRLEKRKYIVRKLNPGDRRSFLITVTSQGSRVADKARTIVADFELAIRHQINQKDIKGFIRIMEVINDVTKENVRPND